MRIMCAILSLILTGLTCPFSAGAVSPVRISGFLCLDPDLQIPPEGRRVTISLEDRKWRPVARTALAVHPGDTRIPWSLSVSQLAIWLRAACISATESAKIQEVTGGAGGHPMAPCMTSDQRDRFCSPTETQTRSTSASSAEQGCRADCISIRTTGHAPSESA